MILQGRRPVNWRQFWLGVAAAALTVFPRFAMSDVALERFMPHMANFQTANTLPKGTWLVQTGSHQTDLNTGRGTGNQTYYGAVDWSSGNNLTLSFSTLVQEDQNNRPIARMTAPTRFISGAFSAKYRFVDTQGFDIAALASAESFSFRTAIFDTDKGESDHLIGSLHLPVTLRAGHKLQLHFTPAVSEFPDDLKGIPYYGTIVSVGAGATWQLNPKLQIFSAASRPISGGNTIEISREISRRTVYTSGARFNYTPKVALEGYVTNGVGTTPATSIVAFWPTGDKALYGVKLHYTPGAQRPSSYRRIALRKPTHRDLQLQQDGLILSTANVVPPGHLRVTASGGDMDNYAGAVAFSPDRDFQLDALIEEHAFDGSVPETLDPTPGAGRWAAGGRIRVFDQGSRDWTSFSIRVLGGRDIEGIGNGALHVAFPLTYEANESLALTAQVAGSAFGDAEILSFGAGANLEIVPGVQIIAEASSVSEGPSAVWAAGVRYTGRGGRFGIDISATNSLARHGYGTLVAQDSIRYSAGVSFASGIFRR